MRSPDLDLVIDVGNTRTKAALFANGRLMVHLAVMNGDRRSLTEFAGEIRSSNIVIGNVTAAEGEWSTELTRTFPGLIVKGDTASPLRMAYNDPGTLGADRLANAVGARAMLPDRDLLAVDLGTCITYDLVGSDGVYRGGAISPGMRMRAQAMHAFSARLPLVVPGADVPSIGVSTDTSLEVGIHHGIVSELQGFIALYRQQHKDLGVILTGGDALRFARALKNGIFAHPFLTLEGLHAILDHHRTVLGADHGGFSLGGERPGTAG